jgi:hypothetical protein
VHTFIQGNVEVQFGRFTTFPDTLLVLLDHLAINEGDSSMTEVSWRFERVGSAVLSTWEGHSVVVSDVAFASAAEFLVADLFHGLNLLFTVASLGLEFNLLLDHIKVLDGVLVELEGLDED